MIATLGRHRFAAVLGNSGSGKSSLVRAGVFPALRTGLLASAGPDWIIVDMRPGSDPIGNLLAALRLAGFAAGLSTDDLRSDPASILHEIRTTFERQPDLTSNVLILADQFEELFRHTVRPESATADYDEKAAFVNLLHTTVALADGAERGAAICAMITMRSDYLGECAQFRGLPEALNKAQYLVSRMTREQLRLVIEGPVHLAGASISPRLLHRLLNDVGEDPDQLPLLQHALSRTWQAWRDRSEPDSEINENDYISIGTMQNALSLHAMRVCEKATEKCRCSVTVIKRMFQRLRERDDKWRETRRTASILELSEVAESTPDEIIQVIECFRKPGRTFLTPFTGPLDKQTEIDVTHECLLRKWTTLAGDWVAEEEDSRQNYLRIAERSADDYLSGPMLERLLEWWESRKPNRAWAERYHKNFEEARILLFESRRRRDEQIEREEAERRLEQQQQVEKARLLAESRLNQTRKRGAYILATGALVFAGAMMWQNTRVSTQSELANTQLLISQAALASETDTYLKVSAVMAAEGVLRQSDGGEARRILSAALALMPKPEAVWPEVKGRIADYAPDGKTVAVASGDELVFVDRATGRILHRLHHQGSEIRSIDVTEERLVTGTADGKVRVWRLDLKADKPVLGEPRVYSCGSSVETLATTPQGTTVACGCVQPGSHALPTLILWQGDRRWNIPVPGATAATAPPADNSPPALALSEDGTRVATAYAGKLSVHTVFSDAEIAPKDGGKSKDDAASVVSLAPDPGAGDTFFYATNDGSVRGWSSESDTPILKLGSSPVAVANSKQLLAVSTADGVVKVWDVSAGSEIARVVLSSAARSLALAPDGDELLAFDSNGGLHRYRLNPNLALPLSNVSSARFTADGAKLAVRRFGTFAIVDVARRTVKTVPASQARPIMLSADLTRVFEIRASQPENTRYGISAFSDGRIQERICNVAVASSSAGSVFSSENRYLATYTMMPRSNDTAVRGIRIFDARTCNEAARINMTSSRAVPFLFTPDGNSLLYVQGGKLKTFDIARRMSADVPLPGTEPVRQLRLSPDGKMLATAADAGEDETAVTAAAHGGSVRLWSWPNPSQLRLLAQGVEVRTLAFSSDSRYLITSGLDRLIRVWTVSDGIERTRAIPGWPILGFAITPDSRLAAVTRQGLFLYPFQGRDLVNELCTRLDSKITREEWQRFMPGGPPTLCAPPK